MLAANNNGFNCCEREIESRFFNSRGWYVVHQIKTTLNKIKKIKLKSGNIDILEII